MSLINFGINASKLYPCFPAQFDNDFDGMDLKKMSFKEAFQKMPLYKKIAVIVIIFAIYK